MLFSNHTSSMARSPDHSVAHSAAHSAARSAATLAVGTVLVVGTLATIVPGMIVGTTGIGICRLIRRITGNHHRCRDAELALETMRFGVIGVLAANSISLP